MRMDSLLRGSLDLIPLNFPLGCGPGPDPPQFPPWVWAWTWSPQFFPWVWAWTWSISISSLGVGLDLIPLNFPLGVDLDQKATPQSRHTPPQIRHPWIRHPPEQTPPGADTPPEQTAPWEQTPREQTPTPPRADTPLWRSAARHAGIPPAMHAGIHTAPPPVNRMTDTRKNITLATTSLRPVIIHRLDQGLSPGHLLSCQPL